MGNSNRRPNGSPLSPCPRWRQGGWGFGAYVSGFIYCANPEPAPWITSGTIQGIRAFGFSLSRGLKLSRRRNNFITTERVCSFSSVTVENPGIEPLSLFNWATHLLSALDTFSLWIVFDRRDVHGRIGWMSITLLTLTGGFGQTLSPLYLSWFALLIRLRAIRVLVRLVGESNKPGSLFSRNMLMLNNF